MRKVPKKLPLAIGLFLAVVGFSIWFFNLRVLNSGDPRLSRAAFGFDYGGRPFTGLIYELSRGWSASWPLTALTFVYQGRLEGPDLRWHPNGRLWISRNYHAGVENGIQRAWYEDGRVQSYKSFVNGVADGDFYEWYQSGILSSFIKYNLGTEVAARTWTGGAKPFYNYLWHEKTRVGLLGDRYCSTPN